MKCPTCGKSIKWQDNPFRPFCSERCKMIDLGRWVSEEYRVPDKSSPVEPSEDSDDRKDSSEDN